MTTPFYNIIFSRIILKEKVNILSWIAIFSGFMGVLLVLRPDSNSINLSILLVFYVAIYNSFIFVLVGKFSSSATSFGFTFYHIIFLLFFSIIFLFFDILAVISGSISKPSEVISKFFMMSFLKTL